jgi:hypothetical protein
LFSDQKEQLNLLASRASIFDIPFGIKVAFKDKLKFFTLHLSLGE